jgi:hypothetical protein
VLPLTMVTLFARAKQRPMLLQMSVASRDGHCELPHTPTRRRTKGLSPLM